MTLIELMKAAIDDLFEDQKLAFWDDPAQENYILLEIHQKPGDAIQVTVLEEGEDEVLAINEEPEPFPSFSNFGG